MSPESQSTTSKLCPVCGTRVNADALRCMVCGADLSGTVQNAAAKPGKARPAVQSSRMPEMSLSYPVFIGLMLLVLAIGAGGTYFLSSRLAPPPGEVTTTATVTMTEMPTLSPTPVTPTATWTPEPSPTPFEYTVKLGDTCGSIAYAFKVSIQSIVLINSLPADCSTLYENQKLSIPQPTPTVTPLPTSTLSSSEATEAACEKVEYTVAENDTLSGIAFNYNVPAAAIREYNGMVNDVVRFGQTMLIPLCNRNATAGPTPTSTLPPPYPPVNLLLPSDGAPFTQADGIITLQWASAGALLENEAYAVTVEDLTETEGRSEVVYVTDTKYIVPSDFLPNDRAPHVIRWWVVTVRQMGTDKEGNPNWQPAGAVSAARVFIWSSLGGGAPAATPAP